MLEESCDIIKYTTRLNNITHTFKLTIQIFSVSGGKSPSINVLRRRKFWKSRLTSTSDLCIMQSSASTSMDNTLETKQLISPQQENCNTIVNITSTLLTSELNASSFNQQSPIIHVDSKNVSKDGEHSSDNDGLKSSPKVRKKPASIKTASKDLLTSCTPNPFRRRSSEFILGKRIRSSRSQSPKYDKDNKICLESPEIVRRLSDCSPVTKGGFQHKKFTDPYYIGPSNSTLALNDPQITGQKLVVPDISYTVFNSPCAKQNNSQNFTLPKRKNAVNEIKISSASFDKDELRSEVQELPSNMPRRKSRTGIFDGIYSTFTTTRKLRLVHQLSMDETRSDVYLELADLANSKSLDGSPPLPYMADLTSIVPISVRRNHFRNQHYSAPTSLDGNIAVKAPDAHAVSYCLDSVLGPATLINYELGKYIRIWLESRSKLRCMRKLCK